MNFLFSYLLTNGRRKELHSKAMLTLLRSRDRENKVLFIAFSFIAVVIGESEELAGNFQANAAGSDRVASLLPRGLCDPICVKCTCKIHNRLLFYDLHLLVHRRVSQNQQFNLYLLKLHIANR